MSLIAFLKNSFIIFQRNVEETCTLFFYTFDAMLKIFHQKKSVGNLCTHIDICNFSYILVWYTLLYYTHVHIMYMVEGLKKSLVSLYCILYT